MVMHVFNYCGCSDILPGELHDTSTILSGSSIEEFRHYLDVLEGQKLLELAEE